MIDHGEKAGTSIRIPFGIDHQTLVNAEETLVAEVRADNVYGVVDPSKPVADEGLRKQVCRHVLVNLFRVRQKAILRHFFEQFLL